MPDRKILTVRIIIFLAAITGFGVISFYMATNRISSFDDMIRYPLYNLRSPALSLVFKTITYIGNWQTVTGLAILLVLIKKTRYSLGLSAGLAALVSNFVKSAVKDYFRRPRPDKALHIISQGGYSFPSGHSMTGLVFYGMLAYAIRDFMLREYREYKHVPLPEAGSSGAYGLSEEKVRELKAIKLRADIVTAGLIALALLIGISRIYVGVHYPSDVLAGWCLGTAILAGAITIRDVIKSQVHGAKKH